MKTLFAFFFLLTSFTVSAHVSGNWIGWVYWGFQGSQTRCDATLELIESKDVLHRKTGLIDCGVITMEVLETRLEKIEDRLFSENTEVGIWSENRFEWTEVYSEDVTIKNTISVKNNSMDYREEWFLANGQMIYDIQGRFFRR